MSPAGKMSPDLMKSSSDVEVVVEVWIITWSLCVVVPIGKSEPDKVDPEISLAKPDQMKSSSDVEVVVGGLDYLLLGHSS
jgi:hypothetical protein